MFTYCYFKYFLGAWLIFVSPFFILVALSTPQESFLFAVEYWGDFLFWVHCRFEKSREGVASRRSTEKGRNEYEQSVNERKNEKSSCKKHNYMK